MSKISKALDKYKKRYNLSSKQILNPKGSQISEESRLPKTPTWSIDNEAKSSISLESSHSDKESKSKSPVELSIDTSSSTEIDERQLVKKPVDWPNYAVGKHDYIEAEKESESASLRDILNVVFKRKWQFILFFLAVMCTVTIGSFLQESIY